MTGKFVIETKPVDMRQIIEQEMAQLTAAAKRSAINDRVYASGRFPGTHAR